MEIAALVSGGVDSSVVVHLLKEAGYTPTLFYIRIGMEDKDKTLHCHSEEDIEIVSYMARKYGCRLEVVSLHNEYWEYVMGYTLDAIKRGFTPNPDVMCNKYIKFGCFEEKWGKDFDKIATGHYATTTEINGKTWLSTAKDPVKDQTDFLGQITNLQIRKLMFPIGHLMKSEVRAIAEAQRLPSARRKDSQGICFLGKINYNDFIERYLGRRTGKIVELETGTTSPTATIPRRNTARPSTCTVSISSPRILGARSTTRKKSLSRYATRRNSRMDTCGASATSTGSSPTRRYKASPPASSGSFTTRTTISATGAG